MSSKTPITWRVCWNKCVFFVPKHLEEQCGYFKSWSICSLFSSLPWPISFSVHQEAGLVIPGAIKLPLQCMDGLQVFNCCCWAFLGYLPRAAGPLQPELAAGGSCDSTPSSLLSSRVGLSHPPQKFDILVLKGQLQRMPSNRRVLLFPFLLAWCHVHA